MTFQKTAHYILKKSGQPLDLIKIADIAFEKDMVKSKAKNPKRSFVETIKKNIRDDTYNSPKLIIIKAPGGKFIVLSEWL
jgi:hypothetical protein